MYKQARNKDIHEWSFRDDFKKFETVGVLSNYQKKRFKAFLDKK